MQYSIDHIINTYRTSIFKICLGYSKTVQDAEDLLQETLINIWKGLKSFRNESNIKTWIYRITVNTCLLSLRKKSLNTTTLDRLSEAAYSTGSDIYPQDDAFLKLHRLINQLPEKDKIVILLYLEELSYHEIAEIIGITANNVGVRINRIKRKISNKFKQNG